jgi:hypothetical protein
VILIGSQSRVLRVGRRRPARIAQHGRPNRRLPCDADRRRCTPSPRRRTESTARWRRTTATKIFDFRALRNAARFCRLR